MIPKGLRVAAKRICSIEPGAVVRFCTSGFSHLDNEGNAKMVDISDKAASLKRTAVAIGCIHVGKAVFDQLYDCDLQDSALKSKKGDVLKVSQIAGILAAKKTPELIPLCHSIHLDAINVDFKLVPSMQSIWIKSTAITSNMKTGIEMEALTAVSVSALTIYDMCKAINKSMIISDICLLKKSGGKSGDFKLDSTESEVYDFQDPFFS
eukprot:CAMPEP_0184694996 /NCGR_PEP_ID=MMETSP0313-20130426/2768_1 /TAXON_ID=2792 /ORGANISM="Porphyridium aerugineum, Strain SAG 1380-2" /LENGTH=207 /DNA_ID=CAMNT_0027153369 /DNA_START=69 /DNA_END=692 /DNA_ORIENTATION=-